MRALETVKDPIRSDIINVDQYRDLDSILNELESIKDSVGTISELELLALYKDYLTEKDKDSDENAGIVEDKRTSCIEKWEELWHIQTTNLTRLIDWCERWESNTNEKLTKYLDLHKEVNKEGEGGDKNLKLIVEEIFGNLKKAGAAGEDAMKIGDIIIKEFGEKMNFLTELDPPPQDKKEGERERERAREIEKLDTVWKDMRYKLTETINKINSQTIPPGWGESNETTIENKE